MERLQRNGGTAGIIAGVLLAVGFIVFVSTGLDPAAAMDPAKALPVLTVKAGRWAAAGIVFALAVGFSVVFTVALSSRLREAAPTRSAAVLYLALIGLAGYALDSVLSWQGAAHAAAIAARDQAAASTVWLSVVGVSRTFNAAGAAFTGAAEIIAGWAILGTGTLGSALGWFSVLTGAISVLALFIQAMPIFLANIITVVAWHVWTGSTLRKG